VSGTVDIYPWDQAYVIANGLDYRPRPLFQSYSVYTPWLIQKNREFLYGDRAPQTILFGIKDIDNRLPATMEGASWLDIMKLYDVVRVRNVFLQLQKTSHSKDYTLNNLESVKTLFNQSVKVPSENVFVKINVKKNLMGSLVNLLYKMPITEIELEYENGSKEVKRLIPGIVSSGFIISPSIKNINDFAAYASGYDLQKVVAFSIIGNSFLYDDMIGIEFFSIERKGFSSTGLIK
jgi:RNAse (barnase) inhibitor barstar